MNKERRKAIADIQKQVDTLKDEIDNLVTQIEDIQSEEQEYFDNMPESFQQGDKGQAAEAAVSALDEAISELQNIDLDSVMSALDTATE